jgi:polar amino acid transport system substrate-binding protein
MFGKILSAAAAVAVLALAVSPAQAGQTLDRVMSTKVLNVATNANWPPQGFLNDANELDGFDIDMAKEIAKRLGVEVKFDTPEWQVMTGGRWQGRWDVAVGSITPTKPRSQVLDFPAVYYFSPYVFVVHKDSKAAKRSDLNGKVIGVETSTTSEDYINRRLEIDAPDVPAFTYDVEPGEVRTYPGSIEPFDDLRLGDGMRVDAIVAPEQTALGAIKNGYPVKVLPGDYAFFEPLVVVADKGDAEWNAKLKEVIGAMRADGTISKFSEKWYGRDYSQMTVSTAK